MRRVRVAGSRRDAAAAAAAAADTRGHKCALCVLSLFAFVWVSQDPDPAGGRHGPDYGETLSGPLRAAYLIRPRPRYAQLLAVRLGRNPSGLLCHSHQAQQTSPSSCREELNLEQPNLNSRLTGALRHSRPPSRYG